MTVEIDVRESGNGKPAKDKPIAEVAEPVAEPTEERPSEGGRGLLTVAGMVRGDEVSLRNALVGGIAADSVSVERGFVRAAIAGQELRIQQAGAGMIVSAGSTELQRGGAQAVISGGSITMHQAGSGFAIAREIEVGQQGTVVFGVTPHLEVQEGGRVLFGPGSALIALGTIGALIAAIAFTVLRRGRARGTEV
jgi:hypothetical protein